MIIFPQFVIITRSFTIFLIPNKFSSIEDKHYTLETVVIENLRWSITVVTCNLFGTHKQNKK